MHHLEQRMPRRHVAERLEQLEPMQCSRPTQILHRLDELRQHADLLKGRHGRSQRPAAARRECAQVPAARTGRMQATDHKALSERILKHRRCVLVAVDDSANFFRCAWCVNSIARVSMVAAASVRRTKMKLCQDEAYQQKRCKTGYAITSRRFRNNMHDTTCWPSLAISAEVCLQSKNLRAGQCSLQLRAAGPQIAHPFESSAISILPGCARTTGRTWRRRSERLSCRRMRQMPRPRTSCWQQHRWRSGCRTSLLAGRRRASSEHVPSVCGLRRLGSVRNLLVLSVLRSA